MASKKNGTLYTGMTNDLLFRVYEHKKDIKEGFTKKYNIKMLVYYEQTDDVSYAIEREKQLKWWRRKWKIELIETENPGWNDLYYELGGTDDLFVDFPLR